MLLEQLIRAAASRTFCTAGKSRPINTAMMAITTRSSMSVKPDLRALRVMDYLREKRNHDDELSYEGLRLRHELHVGSICDSRSRVCPDVSHASTPVCPAARV